MTKTRPHYLAASIAALTSLLPIAHGATLLSRGHTDLGIAFEDGAFDLHVHSEEHEVEFAPDDTVLRVLPSAEAVRPESPAYDFLGVSAGSPMWVLSQDAASAEERGVLLLGVGAEDVAPADFQGNLTARLVDFGFQPEPGGAPSAQFALYTTTGVGTPTPVWTTVDGLSSADAATVVPGTHFDGNWAFTQPGHYQLTVEVSGTLANGTPISGQSTYRFVVKSHASAVSTHLAAGDIIDARGEWALVKGVGPLSVAAEGGGASVLTLAALTRPSGVTSANDTVLAAIKEYDSRIIAREGDPLPALPEVKLKSFTDAFLAPAGNAAFVASLASGIGGVSRTNDTVVLGELPDGSSTALAIALREGDAVPGFTDLVWSRAIALLPANDGSIAMIAQATNPAARGTRTFVVRAVPAGASPAYDLQVLATTGAGLLTDRGLRVVKSFARATRAGQRSIDQHAGIEVLVHFTDGTREIVRFASQPPVAL